MTEVTHRCGWRVIQPVEVDARLDQWDNLQFPMVTIQRGGFRMRMDPRTFQAMSDEEFADAAKRWYREAAFDQMQQDFDTLARQLVGQLNAGTGMLGTDVPDSEIKAALFRWQKAKRDEGPTP